MALQIHEDQWFVGSQQSLSGFWAANSHSVVSGQPTVTQWFLNSQQSLSRFWAANSHLVVSGQPTVTKWFLGSQQSLSQTRISPLSQIHRSLNQRTVVHILVPYSFNITLNIVIPSMPRSFRWCKFLFGFATESCVCVVYVLCMCCASNNMCFSLLFQHCSVNAAFVCISHT